MVSQMTKENYNSTNYNEDDSKHFTGLLEYLKENIEEEDDSEQIEEIDICSLPSLDIYNQNSIYFLSGYILKSIIKNSKCC